MDIVLVIWDVCSIIVVGLLKHAQHASKESNLIKILKNDDALNQLTVVDIEIINY